MKYEKESSTSSQQTSVDENTKPQSIDKSAQITPFHRSDIEYFSKYLIFHNERRKAVVFTTTEGSYGYRCYIDQIFVQDVLIPNKSVHFVEDAANNWSNQ